MVKTKKTTKEEQARAKALAKAKINYRTTVKEMLKAIAVIDKNLKKHKYTHEIYYLLLQKLHLAKVERVDEKKLNILTRCLRRLGWVKTNVLTFDAYWSTYFGDKADVMDDDDK
jgi:hypothetical protein